MDEIWSNWKIFIMHHYTFPIGASQFNTSHNNNEWKLQGKLKFWNIEFWNILKVKKKAHKKT